ncbi:tail fiber assembly protein [Enterobacter chuandaensis]
MNIVFLKDENDNDWYQWLKKLSKETLKVSFNPDSKEIVHFSYDASAIFPLNQIVVEIAPDNVPKELTDAGYMALGGKFNFDNGQIIAAQVDHVDQAQRKKKELLTQAESFIATLQDAVDMNIATNEETTLLLEWRKYRIFLNRIEISNAPDIHWPTIPGSI